MNRRCPARSPPTGWLTVPFGGRAICVPAAPAATTGDDAGMGVAAGLAGPCAAPNILAPAAARSAGFDYTGIGRP